MVKNLIKPVHFTYYALVILYLWISYGGMCGYLLYVNYGKDKSENGGGLDIIIEITIYGILCAVIWCTFVLPKAFYRLGICYI